MEHAGKRSRGFAASIVGSGAPTGAVLATLILMPFSAMGEEAFLSWGWRVPFLLSAILVALAIYMRRSVEETPDFLAMMDARKKESKAKAAIPLLLVFRSYPREVLNGVLGGLACLAMTTLTATFMVNYAITVGGHARSDVLGLLTLVNVLHIFTIPAFAILSDRVGRKPVMLCGTLAGAVLIFPIFSLVASGEPLALLLGLALANPLIHALMGGPISAWLGEKFAADIRYSGMSVTFQIGSTVSAGFTPLLTAWLLTQTGGEDPVLVGIFYIATCAVSALAILLAPESFKRTLPLTTSSS
jgi:MFS family permease